MESSKNNYSSADIQRYHSGQMSEAERHALEKAALDDPFLADALEGYHYSKNPSAEIAVLRERLRQKPEKGKLVPFFFRDHNWMKAAAVLVVVGISLWLVIRNTSSHPADLSLTRANNTKTDSSRLADALSKAAAPVADSSGTNEAVVMNETQPDRHEKASAFENYHNSAPPSNAPSARNLDKKAEKEQKAAITAREKAETEQAGFTALSREARKDSEATVDMAGQKAMALQKENDTVKDLNIVMQPMNQPVSEVVINKNAAPRSSSRDAYPQGRYVTIDTLEPTGGWVKFDDYIASNIKMPDEVKEKKLSGEVMLSFDVDDNGIPRNIRVEKSLCASCDEEAIRLLKEGPKWEKKKNKKGKVKIRF